MTCSVSYSALDLKQKFCIPIVQVLPALGNRSGAAADLLSPLSVRLDQNQPQVFIISVILNKCSLMCLLRVQTRVCGRVLRVGGEQTLQHLPLRVHAGHDRHPPPLPHP